MTSLSVSDVIERLVGGDAGLTGGGVNCVVDPSGRHGEQVLHAVRERVPDSVLVDVAGRTADEALAKVLDALGARVKAPRSWARQVPKKPARLVLVSHLELVGHTRTSGEPQRLLRALGRIGGKGHAVVVASRDARLPGSGDRPLQLSVQAEAVREVPVEVHALAQAEARTVPYSVWQELVMGVTGRFVEVDHLSRVVEQHGELLASEDDGQAVSFRDESVVRELRGQLPSEDRRRTHRHLYGRLAELSTQWSNPEGRADIDLLARYAATALAAHCAVADAATGNTGFPLFTALLSDTRLIVHVPPTALLEAAEGVGMEEAPAGSVLADAVLARDYAILPCTQPTWVAWLHLQATTRGDTQLVEGLERSGVRLPWRVRWSRWRPPAGLHVSYLGFSDVYDLMEMCLHDRPVLAALAHQGRERHVTLYDPQSGDVLATGTWVRNQPPEEAVPGLRWPTPGGEDDRPEVDPANRYLLEAGPVTIDNTVVLGGWGGLFGIEPASRTTPFTGLSLRHRSEALCPSVLTAPATVPAHGPTPRPEDLDKIFEAESGTLYRVQEPLLPDGLTDAATRELLVVQGLPSFRDVHGLGFYGLEPDHRWTDVAQGTHTGPLPPLPEHLLREVPWPTDVPCADYQHEPITLTGPYYAIGRWMGDDVVIDGPTGRILHLPGENREYSNRAETVGRNLHDFLAMVSVWLLGVQVFTGSGDEIETRDVARRVKDLQATIDPVGAAAGIWGVALMDH
ncbi:SUKH-4 family immunity protein [Streptomyces sp. NPDC002795]|uniref:SUKH-4 family immunity protein n=1 Tax=Streptomyces sp. NPDC002795 TaxID=3364665 RepID=UPI003679D1A1